jgi:hypothetical protein
MAWAKLTRSPTFPLSFYVIGGMTWMKTSIDIGAFEVKSIMQHSKTYERLLKTYENDYKIVY